MYSSEPVDGLVVLATAVDELAAQDLDRLADAALADRVLELRRLLNRLEGHWLQTLAAVDARSAAGTEQGQPAPSTAGWLRARLRMGATAAAGWVRTARALYRGPLTQTGQVLADGELSAAHAQVLAHGTHDLPAHTAAEAEPVLVEAARRLDPARLRWVLGHLRWVADPDTAAGRAERQHQRRGLWLSPTLKGAVAWTGSWNRKPARPCWPPWSRWPVRPAPPTIAARPSDAPTGWPSWPAAPWRPAGCRRRAGSGPS
jgi:Domain of unknown function (DUF222)